MNEAAGGCLPGEGKLPFCAAGTVKRATVTAGKKVKRSKKKEARRKRKKKKEKRKKKGMPVGKKIKVVGIRVRERATRAPALQEVITKFGTDVSCRLGIPGLEKEDGLILLVMEEEKAAAEISTELAAMEGVEVKTLEFGGV
jgi:ABC-type methionine transport system ATPase subunit